MLLWIRIYINSGEIYQNVGSTIYIRDVKELNMYIRTTIDIGKIWYISVSAFYTFFYYFNAKEIRI